MKLKITFENSESNLEFLEKDLTIICEVNAYIETGGQQTWDLKPPSATDTFLKDANSITSLELYKNKRTNHVGVSAELDLIGEGICGCEFTIAEVEEVSSFPKP